MTADSAITGGCQCGAVRYVTTMPLRNVHYCHCRMCQRAVGNIFAALGAVRKDSLTWTGQPNFFASSSIAKRGFCSQCGTPLSFAYNDSQWICVTLGSLDHPERVHPTIHYGIESQVPWFHPNDGLPSEPTEETADLLQEMTNNQSCNAF